MTPASLGVDRRVWVRYSCDLESKCHSGRGTDELSWSGRVRDISRGGLNLLLNRFFEPGSYLTVDVPLGPDLKVRALVVRVVHALNFGPANWALGCAFERPLEEKDLLAFQVKKPDLPSDDKRAWIRICDSNGLPELADTGIPSRSSVEDDVIPPKTRVVDKAARNRASPIADRAPNGSRRQTIGKEWL